MPHSRDEATQYIKNTMKSGYLRDKDEPMGAYTFRLPKRLDESLNIHCQQKDRSRGFVVRAALEEYLSKKEGI